jgi:hypothetical protein
MSYQISWKSLTWLKIILVEDMDMMIP